MDCFAPGKEKVVQKRVELSQKPGGVESETGVRGEAAFQQRERQVIPDLGGPNISNSWHIKPPEPSGNFLGHLHNQCRQRRHKWFPEA